jgi:hypothetical protein
LPLKEGGSLPSKLSQIVQIGEKNMAIKVLLSKSMMESVFLVIYG